MGRRSTGTVEPLKTSIRLKFTHLGTRRLETLDLAPTPANLKAAERLMSKIQSAISAGVYRRGDFFSGGIDLATPQPFSEYADEWAETLVVAKSTKRSYQTAMRATWKPAFEGKALADISHSDVKRAVAAKRDGGASAKTINNQLIPLRDLFSVAQKDGLIDSLPTNGVRNLKHQKPPPDPFTTGERDTILGHLHERYDEQIWNYYTFAFFTGIRPSEQIIAGWPHVDWNARKLRIEAALVDDEVKSTKTSLVREVDLNDATYAALLRQKAHTFMKDPEGPIFNDPLHGKPFPNERAQRRRFFIPALKVLGIRHRSAYQTRHTFATALLMGGVNPAYIARQLGHASTAMLFKHYAKWIDGADKGAEAAKANAVLMGHYGGPKLGGEEASNG